MDKKIVKTKDGVIPLEFHQKNKEFQSLMNSAPPAKNKAALVSFLKKFMSFYNQVNSTLK